MTTKGENKMKESVANILRLELMEQCNCGSGQEVVLFCKSQSCPDFQSQKYYCILCSQKEGKHEHKPFFIASEIEAQSKKWHEFKTEIMLLYEEGTNRYKAMEPLIRYVEDAMMDPEATFEREIEWVSAKYSQLKQVYNEGIGIYNERVKELITTAKLLDLIAINPEYDRLLEAMRRCSTFSNLNEDALFKEYRSGFQIAGTKPFKDFS